ncbi:MAG: class I SAM-dependent methyltransferase [Acidimicrobiia bacterium]|nr:class I SAM-dependent methyltransferase [Acidimicrobiia bacterium]
MAELHRDSFLSGQYFLAVAGMAAMRRILSRPSEGRPRLDDMRAVLDAFDEFPNNIEIDVVEHDVASGYQAWAPVYDGPNPAIEAEQPIVHDMIRQLAVGRALDAACGTGRHAGFLAELGHDTIGVDATAGMLDVARSNHPDVDFRSGRLEALPVDDASVDVVTSALAVCHAPELGPVFAEFARVLAPGGSVIVSDPHPTTVHFGGVAGFRDADADPTAGFTLPFVANLHHPMHTYVEAAIGAGLTVAECREPTFPQSGLEANPAYAIVPDAVRQAFEGLPFIVIWRFTKAA